jgi:hypothetical protein
VAKCDRVTPHKTVKRIYCYKVIHQTPIVESRYILFYHHDLLGSLRSFHLEEAPGHATEKAFVAAVQMHHALLSENLAFVIPLQCLNQELLYGIYVSSDIGYKAVAV